MAAPTIESTYPANSDTGIPTGITIKIYFDTGVDEKSVKDSVALYGRDTDMTSGPDTAVWVDQDTGDNPFFLASPGFKGLIPLKLTLAYYTIGTTTEVDPGTITSQADEVSANVGHVAKFTLDPKYNATLPADANLTLVIAGDPDNQDVGVSARTVFDVQADVGNTGSGSLAIYGTWEDTGAGSDEINIEVTAVGNIGTAEYKWWYTSAGVSSASDDLVTNRRYRTLSDGLQIRFSGSNFQIGDTWTFGVKAVERMEESTVVAFSTNDGSYTEAPASPSTPATSSPPSTVLPTQQSTFEVLEMTPDNGSYNVSVKNRKIVIKFSEDLDPDTVTDDAITLWKYPVDGVYEDTYSPVELQKTIDVDGDTITIRF
jgi:hypothetical protein